MIKIISIILLVFFCNGAYACSVGVASGEVTVDGRPISWKVRDIDIAQQQLVYVWASPYDYVGVRSAGGMVSMGLNEAGLSGGNSLVVVSGSAPANKVLLNSIFRNNDSLNIDFPLTYYSGNFPFMDSYGNTAIFEVNRDNPVIRYNATDPDRSNYGFVVRANEFHYNANGTDDNIGGRFYTGTYNIRGMKSLNRLSVKSIVQGYGGYEFVRYGPGRSLASIVSSYTMSATVVHGVKQNEDPALATMWTVLGPTNYSIAVPVWTTVTDIPTVLRGAMYDRAKSLYNKGSEVVTQNSVFPLESHIFDEVLYDLLPQWRNSLSINDMIRVEHQIANDAYSLLNCLDRTQRDNKAPVVGLGAEVSDLTVNFNPTANDLDGYISSAIFNYGDGTIGNQSQHTYNFPGRYLASYTVEDDDGVSSTDWLYVQVSESGCNYPLYHLDYCRDCGPCEEGQGDCDSDSECVGDLICGQITGVDVCEAVGGSTCLGDFDADSDVDGDDLAVFAADFGRTDCSGDCEGDFDNDNDVDGSDMAVFAADFGRTNCE